MKWLIRALTPFVLLATLIVLAACGELSATPTPAPATAVPATATVAPEPAATATPEVVTPTESAAMTDTTPVSETIQVSETASVSETTAVSLPAESYTDPFAYCAAVGTADAPAAPYSGEAVPESVVQGLQTAMGTDMPLEVLGNGTSWRCMDQQVYACFVGANLPCTEKADTNETPNQAELDLCADPANTNADVIPAAVTGHSTVYSWRCTDGKPAIVEQVFQTDAQGFVSDIWYALPAP